MRGHGQGRPLMIASGLAIGLTMAYLADAAPAFPGPARQTVRSIDVSSRQVLVMLRLPPPHFRPDGDYSSPYDYGPTRAALRREGRRIARVYGLTMIDDWPMPLIGVDCFKMVLVDGRATEAVVALLNHDASIAWSQPVAIFDAQNMASGN